MRKIGTVGGSKSVSFQAVVSTSYQELKKKGIFIKKIRKEKKKKKKKKNGYIAFQNGEFR